MSRGGGEGGRGREVGDKSDWRLGGGYLFNHLRWKV